jgi:hypothetical protein
MTEMPLMPLWFTLFVTIWVPLGPLVGIGIGHYLSRYQQRKQWFAENAKQECRELISTMASTFTTVATYYAQAGSLPLSGPHSSDETRELHEAIKSSQEIFYSRLFIDKELNKRDMRNRWIGAVGRYEKDTDAAHFAEEFATLAGEIRNIARSFIK